MKKNFFAALGATSVALLLMFTLTLSSENTNATQQYKSNLNALVNESDLGKCTGPKPQGGNCESSNDHKCSDNDNCSSISGELD